MPFCTNCGTEVKEGVNFCPNCGKSLGESKQDRAVLPKPAGNKKRITKIIIPLIIVAVALAAFVWMKPNAVSDKNLENAIRTSVNQPKGKLALEDLQGVVELDASGMGVKSLKGIEKLASLEVLKIHDNRISDITPLLELPALREVEIEGNELDTSLNSPDREFVEELKAKGVKVSWLTTFERCYEGGSIFAIQQTEDGGYILAGVKQSSDLDRYNGWLIKADNMGNEVWSRTFDGGERFDTVQQTDDGGYIISGWMRDNAALGLLVKTDEEGEVVWSNIFSNTVYGGFHSVRQTNDGGYIIVGEEGNTDGTWLIKTDEKGNEVWVKDYASNRYDSLRCVQQTSDGGYVIVGTKATVSNNVYFPQYGD
jgi:hypothetical protein